MKFKLAILCFLAIIPFGLGAADLLDDIANALRSGDAKSVSRYFGNTIDLTILTKEEVYSKTQAEQVLKDFFLKNPPRSFSFLHKGESKEGARYAIGTMTTSQGQVFRTYFFVKVKAGQPIIQELRFMME
ncbi:MAG: hypothetical protein RLZZ630_1934 [Bacteroidota bacterium]|jgi:hypothetical protein